MSQTPVFTFEVSLLQPCILNYPDGVASEPMHRLYQVFYGNEGLRPKPQSV